ncbi:heavy metal-associated isoprenylated plant protein 7-like [Zingiber officinale]|uniref:HMA domain-containing protein n=1 Tax=Zingiber officinale TaxID=94328 RepID=A0A8J5CD63_ZINOF|nr:heavy metal-associated isoprenylated plant protein 7-like [Zingiber officinale]KAG6471594.1 hypothetical protein ZIOFF_069038 [Zingiber officinale]
MSEEQKEEEKKEEEPPELVLRVDMHCEACARKVERSLRKFLGVDDVKTDSKSRTVVIKGKEVDPAKIIERIQKKTGKKVELISPLPPPPPEEEEKKEEPEAPQEEKQEEPPKPITVVLKVRMHCEKCAQVLKKRVTKIEGVESVKPDLANSQVTVTGFVDPEKLVENVYRRTRKQASIVPEEVKEEEKKDEEPEKKEENTEGEKQEEGKEDEENIKYDMNKYEYYVQDAYTPQAFSDENPNACSVM